eukprot:4319792-Karenia_brevis.AAC.1
MRKGLVVAACCDGSMSSARRPFAQCGTASAQQSQHARRLDSGELFGRSQEQCAHGQFSRSR